MTAKRRGRGRPAIPLTWRMMIPPEVAVVAEQVELVRSNVRLHRIELTRTLWRYDALDVEGDLGVTISPGRNHYWERLDPHYVRSVRITADEELTPGDVAGILRVAYRDVMLHPDLAKWKRAKSIAEIDELVSSCRVVGIPILPSPSSTAAKRFVARSKVDENGKPLLPPPYTREIKRQFMPGGIRMIQGLDCTPLPGESEKDRIKRLEIENEERMRRFEP